MIEATRKRFPELTIQKFFPLFATFPMWPSAMLADYLRQYKVLRGIHLTDPTWTEFFKGVLERYTLL